MRNRFKSILMLIVACMLAADAGAQVPLETRNAALRYWMAFVDLQDVGADEATQVLIEKTLTGQAIWDETKLGRIVDDNLEAIGIMQRASQLPECDWGYEYVANDPAPVHFMGNSALALARLNALYGMRLASKGDTDQAVEAWLAGIRFSQHLAQGSSLFLTLTARSTLLPNLKALTQAVQAGSLTTAQREQAAAVVRGLPESAFDWGSAWDIEALALDKMWEQLGSTKEHGTSRDPLATYQDLTGLDPAGILAEQTKRHTALKIPPGVNGAIVYPPQQSFDAFHNFMKEVAAILRLPPATARDRLSAMRTSERRLDPLLTHAVPNFEKVNQARADIAAARQQLLRALASR